MTDFMSTMYKNILITAQIRISPDFNSFMTPALIEFHFQRITFFQSNNLSTEVKFNF